MTCDPRTAAPPRPQRGMVVDGDRAGPEQRQSNSANGTRPENGMYSRREYSILAPEDPTGGPATAGPPNKRGRRWGHKGDGRPRADADVDGDGDRGETGQRALLARGMQEEGNKDRIPRMFART